MCAKEDGKNITVFSCNEDSPHTFMKIKWNFRLFYSHIYIKQLMSQERTIPGDM